jgi:serine/threonine protein phosphatase PrpC
MTHVLKNCQNPDDVLAEMEKYLLTRYTDDCDNYTALLLRFVSEENTENQENATEE